MGLSKNGTSVPGGGGRFAVVVERVVYQYVGEPGIYPFPIRTNETGTIWKFDLDKLIWMRETVLPASRKVHDGCMVYFNGELIIAGGATLDETVHEWTLFYNLSSKSWRFEDTPNMTVVRRGHGCQMDKRGRLWALGGYAVLSPGQKHSSVVLNTEENGLGLG